MCYLKFFVYYVGDVDYLIEHAIPTSFILWQLTNVCTKVTKIYNRQIEMLAIFWNMRNLSSSKYIWCSRIFNNGSNTVERKRKWIIHKHNWIGGSCNGWDLTFSPITEGFKNQIYQRHFSWNDLNIFGQHIFVARLWK